MSNRIPNRDEVVCPVCGAASVYLDALDFNKSCLDLDFVQSTLVPYYLCENCKFCFAPIFHEWSEEMFSKHIYNDQYLKFDPEYISIRPLRNAHRLLKIFKDTNKSTIAHLDYGGGNGVLSKTFQKHGWNSKNFDPMIDKKMPENVLHRTFNLITMFEVLEHVSQVYQLFQDLCGLLRDDGIILLTTALSDTTVVAHNTPLTWWYASPRNGHVSLFSKESLEYLSAQYGLSVTKFSRRNPHDGRNVDWYYALYRDSLPLWTRTRKREGLEGLKQYA